MRSFLFLVTAIVLASLSGLKAQPPGPPTDPSTVEVYITGGTAGSHIDAYTSYDYFYVRVAVNYSCKGPGYKVSAKVWDVNSQAWMTCGYGPAFMGQTEFTTAGATGTAWFWFVIPANSTWGQGITNGDLDTCAIEAKLTWIGAPIDTHGDVCGTVWTAP